MIKSWVRTALAEALTESGEGFRLDRLLQRAEEIGRQSQAQLQALELLATRIAALEAQNQALRAAIGRQETFGETLSRDLWQARDSALTTLQGRLAELQRSAPGRGNVLLSEERLLTRFSLPPFFAEHEPIYLINSDDRLILPKLAMNGYYELPSTRYVCKTVKPKQHVVDVGANFGYYSVIFASLVGWQGRVLAFEPEPRMHALLQENLQINWVDAWAQAEPRACTDRSEQVRFYTSKTRSANTGPAPPLQPSSGETVGGFSPIVVAAAPLDSSVQFLQGRVDFIKIDVEGGEPLVLRGARQTIAANPHLRIMMEWSPGQIRAAGHDVGDFVDELAMLWRGCFTIGAEGELERNSFDWLRSCEAYQNIVLWDQRP